MGSRQSNSALSSPSPLRLEEIKFRIDTVDKLRPSIDVFPFPLPSNQGSHAFIEHRWVTISNSRHPETFGFLPPSPRTGSHDRSLTSLPGIEPPLVETFTPAAHNGRPTGRSGALPSFA